MKIFKKIAFLQIFALSLILFSCASTPKTEENFPETNISGGEIPETENSLPDENSSDSAEPEFSDSENTDNNSAQDFSDLTEPLTEEQNPELPELPELSPEAETAESTKEPSSILEPQVKDEPSVEKDKTDQNQNNSENALTDENGSSGQNILPKQDSHAQTENAESSSEQNKTPDDSNSENTNTTDIIEENSNFSENSEQMPSEETRKPSRSVTIKKNQNIDIIYPGKGWIYQGNIDENGNVDSRNRNFIFGGRKLGGKDTSFTLRSRNPGTYLLHFFKNDTLTGKYIDDFLEVIVQNENIDSAEHITVPDYAEVVPPKVSITAETAKIKEQKNVNTVQPAETEAKNAAETKTEQKSYSSGIKNSTENSKNSDIDTIIQTTESAPGTSSPSVKTGTSAKNAAGSRTQSSSNFSAVDETADSGKSAGSAENQSESLENMGQDSLLELAKKYYNEKKYQQAFSVISKFFDKATERLDEGLFLQGQILEEKSPVQNIKSAIESYDLVVNNYPASPLWDKANKRSIFLKRFYINIR